MVEFPRRCSSARFRNSRAARGSATGAADDAPRGGAHRDGVSPDLFKRDCSPLAAQQGAREAVASWTRRTEGYGARGSERGPPPPTRSRLGARDRASVGYLAGAEWPLRSAGDRGAWTRGSPPRSRSGRDPIPPALKLGGVLGESALPRREIILISDFQRRGWEQTPGRDDVKLPERTTLTPVNVAVGDTSNLSVTPVSLQRTRFENHDRVTVTAGVVNHSAAAARATLALEMDGQSIQSQSTEIAAGGSSSVTFAPLPSRRATCAARSNFPTTAWRATTSFFVVSPSRARACLRDQPPGRGEGSALILAARSPSASRRASSDDEDAGEFFGATPGRRASSS